MFPDYIITNGTSHDMRTLMQSKLYGKKMEVVKVTLKEYD